MPTPEGGPTGMHKGDAAVGASVLADVRLPAAVIAQEALDHNIAWMQQYADRHSAKLAPHGKTTMAPALFRRQLEAGAWAITVATATQGAAAFGHGITLLLMANQLVGESNMALIADLMDLGCEFYCLVDSVANIEQLNRFFGTRGQVLPVFVELGSAGGRCGVRTIEQARKLAAVIQGCTNVTLVGVEGFEAAGLHTTSASVHDYARQLIDVADELRSMDAFSVPRPLISASGSAWFDVVGGVLGQLARGTSYQPVLRPGCYVVHDHQLYVDAMAGVKHRNPHLQGGLESALTVFAHIQSRPEPGLAIAALGKRDISCDPYLPVPLRRYRAGESPGALDGWRVERAMDQHLFVALPNDADVRIGDVVEFGASHPCLTFDKWRRLLLVDVDLKVQASIATYF